MKMNARDIDIGNKHDTISFNHETQENNACHHSVQIVVDCHALNDNKRSQVSKHNFLLKKKARNDRGLNGCIAYRLLLSLLKFPD